MIVLDAGVVIGFLSRSDAHHERAVELLRRAGRRCLCAVSLSELLVGPARRGDEQLAQARAAISALAIEIVPVDAELALTAARIRADTGLKLPDAYVVATAVGARREHLDVELATFDERLAGAWARLR